MAKIIDFKTKQVLANLVYPIRVRPRINIRWSVTGNLTGKVYIIAANENHANLILTLVLNKLKYPKVA